MTSEDLKDIIYVSNYCPDYNCEDGFCKKGCRVCAGIELTKYENEIYNKALEDFKNEMHKFWGGMRGMEDVERVANNLRKGA